MASMSERFETDLFLTMKCLRMMKDTVDEVAKKLNIELCCKLTCVSEDILTTMRVADAKCSASLCLKVISVPGYESVYVYPLCYLSRFNYYLQYPNEDKSQFLWFRPDDKGTPIMLNTLGSLYTYLENLYS